MSSLRERLQHHQIELQQKQAQWKLNSSTETYPPVRSKEKTIEFMRDQFRSLLLPIFLDVAQVQGLHISGSYVPFAMDFGQDNLLTSIFKYSRGKVDGPLKVEEDLDRALIRGTMEWDVQSGRDRFGRPHRSGNKFDILLRDHNLVDCAGGRHDISSAEGYSALQDSVVAFFVRGDQRWSSDDNTRESA